MNDYYYTQQPQEDDLVDERWDGYIQEQSKVREQQTLDNLFQQLAITKELSPPLSSNDKNQQINTSFFREDIEGEEHAYFTRNNSPLNTPLEQQEEQEEEECDYLTSHEAIQENNNQYLHNDTTPIESIDTNNTTTTKSNNTSTLFTTTMDQYQMDLVHYHLTSLLDMTETKEIIGLPTMYQHYLANVKNHIYSSLPCTF